MDAERIKEESLDTMFAFLQMGSQKPNVEALKENCEWVRKAMLQKTAGQRKDKKTDVDFKELDIRINFIVIEAMALYLSGALDDLGNELKSDENADA